MKKILLGLIVLLLFFPYLNTQAEEPNIDYYQTRYQIACYEHDSKDARCFWNKVEYIHAKEVLDRDDIMEYLSRNEVERVNNRLRFLEQRHQSFCTDVKEPAYFCSALKKMVEKGHYFLENEQLYSHEGSTSLMTTVSVK